MLEEGIDVHSNHIQIQPRKPHYKDTNKCFNGGRWAEKAGNEGCETCQGEQKISRIQPEEVEGW